MDSSEHHRPDNIDAENQNLTGTFLNAMSPMSLLDPLIELSELEPAKNMKPKCSKKTMILGTLFIIMAVTLITLYFVYQEEIKSLTDDYIDFMEHNKVLGVFLYWLIYTISMPLCIPATIFIIFGAYIFGRVFGFLAGFFIFGILDYT